MNQTIYIHFTFFPLSVCILLPSGDNLIMRQAGDSLKKMLTCTTTTHEKKARFLPSIVQWTHTHTHIYNVQKYTSTIPPFF